MARRHCRNSIRLIPTADPGKDLYAYLYLITVISFIFLVTAGKMPSAVSKHEGPDQLKVPGVSSLATVASRKLGKLVKKENRIYLKFGNRLIDPINDLHRLEAEGFLAANKGSDGKEKKTLYLESAETNSVLLSEYLVAFERFSQNGIGIAFAEKVK